MPAQRPQLRGQRGEPRVSDGRVRRGGTEIVQRLHQAAGVRREVGNRLGQRIRIRNGGLGLRQSRWHPRLPGELTRPAAKRDQVPRPDSPPRAGQQPGQGVGRARIVHHAHGRHDILHLGHREQPAEPDHLDRDTAGLDRGAQRGELGPLAAEHGDVGRAHRAGPAVGPGSAVRRDAGREAEQPGDLAGHPSRLVGSGLKQRADDLAAPRPPGRGDQPGHSRRGSAQALLQGSGRVQHPPGVAEAGGQLPHRCRAAAARREVRGEPAQVSRTRAAPAVDRLARVADRGDGMPAAEQRPQQHQLGMAGVLVLIEEHHLIAGPLGGADLRVRGGDPGGQRHLVTVVNDFPGGLGRCVGGHQRQ